VPLLTIASLPLGTAFAVSVLAGGAFSAVNMEGLILLVHRVTDPASGRLSFFAVLAVAFRYLLLGVGLFVIVTVWHVSVLGLSLGLSAPAAAVLVEFVRDAVREFRSHSDIDS
jgi:hypothetical protein